MSDITLSSAVRRNLLSLQDTAMLMGKTQERLATGKKVNSALDNPTNFFTAASLSSRSKDLGRLLDSVNNAVQTLEAADNGIKAITKLVESAQASARQAQQGASAVVKTAETSTSVAETLTPALAGVNIITLTPNGGTAINIDISLMTNLEQVENAIDDIDGFSARLIPGDTPGEKKLEITGGDGMEDFAITDTGSGAGTALTKLGLTATTSTARAFVTDGKSEVREKLKTEFNDLLKQIDDITKDAGFNGNNLLANTDLKVIFNEDGSSSLTIKGVDISAAGLTLSPVTGDTFQYNDDIDTVLSSLDTALATLRSQASTFGSNLSVVQTRQDFTKSMMNTLETGAANLTLADINQEGANMLALQTRQQLSTTALSMASQADQSVLSLF
uniref:Flagellin n=1 Tax=OCS116 cluster bacterium TaxID=2030921 RepID=A0A2A4Z1C1_9PROT